MYLKDRPYRGLKIVLLWQISIDFQNVKIKRVKGLNLILSFVLLPRFPLYLILIEVILLFEKYIGSGDNIYFGSLVYEITQSGNIVPQPHLKFSLPSNIEAMSHLKYIELKSQLEQLKKENF